jgi:hypothetical protein
MSPNKWIGFFRNKEIKKRPTTRNIKNWAESGKYEHFNIK